MISCSSIAFHFEEKNTFRMVYTLTVHLYANEKPDSIERIKAKLIEAARIYRKDKETIDCKCQLLEI